MTTMFTKVMQLLTESSDLRQGSYDHAAANAATQQHYARDVASPWIASIIPDYNVFYKLSLLDACKQV